MPRLLSWSCAGLFLAAPTLAHAHITMLAPVPRDPVNQKQGPCGVTGSVRGEQVTVVESGSMLELRWEQMYDHDSHYRVSFDDDGDDDFVDPLSYDDRYTNDTVLLDGIPTGSGPFSVLVPLPDVECDRCTLQLVQVMYDKGPYEAGTNDLYYQCADLVLKRGAGGSEGAFDGGVPEDPADGWSDAGNAGPRSNADQGGYYTGSGMAPSSQPASDGARSSGTCSVHVGAAAPGGVVGFVLGAVGMVWRRRRRR